MAIKKSGLYSSLWASCDELRGGMDASQYKDYALVLLFVKYVSDKYAGRRCAPITIPDGASFVDMVALKGKSDIGDQINKRIIAPLEQANSLSFGGIDFASAEKLGSGKEMVDRLTNLIATFESPALDFSRNRADGDDLLGDAYEYLMRHFATENLQNLRDFYIALPPSPIEVRAIAEALSDVDGLLDALDQFIAKKRDIKQATTQQLLSGQNRLPGFNGVWETRRLDSIADIRSGGTPSTSEPRFWDRDNL